MNWNTKVGQKKIGKVVASVLKAQAPKCVGKTYLVFATMRQLGWSEEEWDNAYKAVVSYIDSNTGRGKPLTFKETGIPVGYALKANHKVTKRAPKKGKRA